MRIEDGAYSDRIKRLRKKAMSLPLEPGVYIMHNTAGKIIYIGKAKALKNRVSQYFGSETNHTDKVRQMVSQVEDFEYIICDSEFEALILECSLIKQHMPKYNILLKDDKGYHYIKITADEYPIIKSALQIEDDGAKYIGPYSSGWVVKQTVAEVQKLFKLPQCGKTIGTKKKERPCLNFYIGTCSAPCAGKISKNEYLSLLNEAVEFIRGGSKLSVKQLENEMNAAADALDFERAARLRDRIQAFKRITEKQKVTACTYKCQDVVALANGKTASCAEVFIFREWKLCDRKQYILEKADDLQQFRSEFLKRYYSENGDIPERIVIDGECADRELLPRFFSEIAKRKVEIVIPQIGEQKRLVEMCRANAEEYLAEMTGRKDKNAAVLDELAELLGLDSAPEYIESYDISHTAGSENVAGMVVFKDGVPLKSAYKKFKIKSFSGQDDCRSMAETIERRFEEYRNAKTDEGFGKMPDLILLDGGHTQLNAVNSVLERLGIQVPVFGMVKDGKHKTNAIAANGSLVSIKANRAVYNFVYAVQEEVHRFAIGYHRSRSQNAMLNSELTDIPGVGKATALKLIKHFKSIGAVKKASVEELCKVKGLSRSTADNIYNYFNTDDI